MKKTVLTLSVILLLLVGFFFPNMGNVSAQTEQVPEDVLEVIDYRTDDGIFKEVRNLQEYRQLLSAQGLSDYEVAIRMLEVSGYTQEQIDRMPEEAILQNLNVKDSKVQISQAEKTAAVNTLAVSTDPLEGLNIYASYRTIELSRYANGRDPEDFLLLSFYFDWAGARNGMPQWGRSNDFLAIYSQKLDDDNLVTFKLNREPFFPSFPNYEIFSATYEYHIGGVIKKEVAWGKLDPQKIMNNEDDKVGYNKIGVAFSVPDDTTLTTADDVYNLSGYY